MKANETQKPDFISRHVTAGRYSFIDLAPEKRENITLNCVGREDCRDDYFLDRKDFKYHAVEIIAAGEWTIETPKGTQTLTPGSVFPYSPSTPFTMQAIGTGPWIKYFFDFSGSEAGAWLEHAKLPPLQVMWTGKLQRFMDLLDQLLDADEYPRDRIKELGKHYLSLIQIHLGQDIQLGKTEERNTGFQTYQRCRDYLNQHFKELNSIKEWSDACHISQAYLSRLFGKHTSESPLQLMTRLKMEYAAQRLRFDGIPVKNAAREVGFDDPYHFSRVFKNTYGLPPSHLS